MITPTASRIAIALVLIAACAAAVLIGDGSGLAALAAALAGVATLFILTLGQSATQAPVVQRNDPQPEFVVEARLLEAISEPVLIVVDGRVRLAIRHPAAADRLAAGAEDGSVELVGLGGRDQRVQMRVASLSTSQRLIHLIDRTTSYAAERARIDFVANASHELRTPLAAILGFIETLDDPNAGGDDEIRARFLEVMFKEARRMQRLIDDLISLSRIEAEKYRLPDTAVALPALIEEIADELRDEAGEWRANVILDINADMPAVNADRAQLSQVIHNLVGNAFKYGRQGAPVTIALDRDGSLIRLSVTDQGEGIAPEHLPRLTERFYRVDSGRSRTLGGTGLGLAIVKHIVERHRGRLDIVSKVGIGTTVSILLPTRTKAVVTELTRN